MRLLPALLIASTAALSLCAQDPARQGRTPILVVRSVELEPVIGLGTSLGLIAKPPELGAGEHYVLTLDAARRPVLGTATGEIHLIELWADPAALMEAFSDEVQDGRMIVQGAMGVALMAQGFDARQVARLLNGLFEFPRQIAEATMTIDGEPWAKQGEPLRVELAMRPAAGSAFAAFAAGLKPNPAGAPELAAPDTSMEVRFSLTSAAMQAASRSLTRWWLPLLIQDEETLASVGATTERLVALYDGTGALAFGAKGELATLMGFTDGAALRELMASEDYLAMVEAQQGWNRNLEVELEPGAIEHRGVRLLRTTVFNDGPPNPMMPDGEMTTFTGAVGDQLLVCVGADRAKRLIDTVADGGLERSALPGGAVLTFDFALARFAEEFGGQPMPPEAPRRMSASLTPSEGWLRLRFRLE